MSNAGEVGVGRVGLGDDSGENDDSGGGLNSLIAYRTEQGGEYTIIATSYWGGFGEFPEFEDRNGD